MPPLSGARDKKDLCVKRTECSQMPIITIEGNQHEVAERFGMSVATLMQKNHSHAILGSTSNRHASCQAAHRCLITRNRLSVWRQTPHNGDVLNQQVQGNLMHRESEAPEKTS